MKFTVTEKLVRKTGGAFKLSTLIQKRLRELVRGAPSLIKGKESGYFETALEEAEEDCIKLKLNEKIDDSTKGDKK